MTISFENTSILSDHDRYSMINNKFDSLFLTTDHPLSVVSNFTSLLKEYFQKISWIGFYFMKDEHLILGPFQGKFACTDIKIGNGVCGNAAKEKKTIIVPDVHEFEGHIACDAGSNSEIVVPLFKNDRLLGVLDLDSYDYSAFNEVDKEGLESLCKKLSQVINNNYSFV